MGIYRTIGPLVCKDVCLSVNSFFVKDFSGTAGPRIWKFDTNIKYGKWYCLLAHLSRRLKGELIVYRSIWRPCVSASVCA